MRLGAREEVSEGVSQTGRDTDRDAGVHVCVTFMLKMHL